MDRAFHDPGAIVLGLALLAVGVYYLLTMVGVELPDLDWDEIWPLIPLME